MGHYENSIFSLIKKAYNSFTAVERGIGDFFLANTCKQDFSAKAMAGHLFVSEASLSRFAKKCGFTGYREFLFHYKAVMLDEGRGLKDSTTMVFNTYEELLQESYSLVDEAQVERIAGFLAQKSRVFAYGKGSSGLVARELMLRFMRIGLDVEAIEDSHVMKMNLSRINEDCLVFGITLSGNTPEVVSSLKSAKHRGATTVLMSANCFPEESSFYDECIRAAAKDQLHYGMLISPQFPLLVLLDVLYGYFLRLDLAARTSLHRETLHAFEETL